MDTLDRIKKIRTLLQELSEELKQLEDELPGPKQKINLNNSMEAQLKDFVEGAQKKP